MQLIIFACFCFADIQSKNFAGKKYDKFNSEMRIVTVKVKKNDVHESFSIICRLIENNNNKIIG